ncbi:MAG: hypothetical protein CMH57_07195 [Myxococcales bacterium]|nr:hypothetical protein [Myxococcales bacterium]
MNHLRWHVVRKTVPIPLTIRTNIRSSSVVLSRDGRHLVVGGGATVHLSILDAETLALQEQIPTRGDTTNSVQSVMSGRYILANASRGRIAWRNLRVNRARDLFVLDGLTLELIGVVQLGENLGNIHDLGDGTVLVPSVQSRRLSRLDLATLTVVEGIRTAERDFLPTNISVRDDGAIALVTEGAYLGRVAVGTEVLVMDPQHPAERSRFEFYGGLQHPRGSLFHPDGRHILIADRKAHALVTLDWVQRRTADTRPIGDYPEDIGWMPDRREVWITFDGNRGERKVALVEVTTGQLTEFHLPGHTTNAPVFSPDGRMMYVPLSDQNGVGVIDLKRRIVIDFIATTKQASDLAISADGRRLYVAHHGGTHVSLLE